MRNSFYNKLNMVDETLALVAEQTAIVSQISALETAVDKLKDCRLLIADNLTIQNTNIEGIAIDKMLIKGSCAKWLSKLSLAISSYAHTHSNFELKMEIKRTLSEVVKLRDENLISYADIVLPKALLLATELEDFGVVAADITATTNAVKDFKLKMVEPKIARDARKTCTANLPVLFKQASSILKNEMDTLVNVLGDEYADFKSNYKNARNIIDYRGKRRKPAPLTGYGILIGVVSNSADGSFIEEASVTIVEANLTIKTDEDGAFYFENLPSGTYTINVSALTYLSKTIADIEITDGSEVSQDVELDSDESNNTSNENETPQV
ncbi:MAG: carboxypeptidase-like regulatory domain-containing protein [Bacteroidota bacterium]